MTRRGGLARLRHRRLRIGVTKRMFELPPHTGYGRVWTEVLPRIAALARLEVDAVDPDVRIMDGHYGDPGVEGPVVMLVYEVNWGSPEFDREHDPGFVEVISRSTEASVWRADRIVTGATSSKRQIIDAYGFPADDVHVVPFGVDAKQFNPDMRSAGRALVRARQNETRPYVLFAASLHPRKNLPAVRAAVTGLAHRGFPHDLVVVAAPAPDRQDSSDLEREGFADLPGFPGRIIRFVDPSDDELAALMAGADAVCQPSNSEGFGLTVLEAMAAGAALIVSDRGSLPEVVGQGGRVVEPTGDAVENALVDIITNPDETERMRGRALQRAKELSWDRTAEGWVRAAARAARTGETHLRRLDGSTTQP